MNLVSPAIAGLMPGGGEWIWILLIVLVLFGGAKLPSLAKGLGQSVKEFKKASRDDDDEEHKSESKKTETTTTKTTSSTGSN